MSSDKPGTCVGPGNRPPSLLRQAGGDSALSSYMDRKADFKAVEVCPVTFAHNSICPSSSICCLCLPNSPSTFLKVNQFPRCSIHALGCQPVPKVTCVHFTISPWCLVRAVKGTIPLQTTKLLMSEPSLNSCLSVILNRCPMPLLGILGYSATWPINLNPDRYARGAIDTAHPV